MPKISWRYVRPSQYEKLTHNKEVCPFCKQPEWDKKYISEYWDADIWIVEITCSHCGLKTVELYSQDGAELEEEAEHVQDPAANS